MENTLYYGDNLEILKEYIKDETIDLIYLDPPFNSNKNYNVLFGEKNGTQSHAQIEAFEDTWHWDIKAEKTYSEIVEQLPNRIASLIKALRCFLGENDMMAYLVMMAIRLHELHRTLKSTGSIYLHCDPTASHYLKFLMDAIFGVKGFRNEIIWNYGRGAGNIKHALPKGHETILFYSKDIKVYWNSPLKPYSEKLLKSLKKDEKGYYYTRGQRTGRRKISNWEKESKIGLKTYIDLEKGGTKCTDVWDDLGGYPTRKESLGYPTQKPEALLARIIRASSNKKDLVLDPFCGCGTTISVAEKLKRKWIGIDITHLAISLMKHRLENTFVNNVSYRVIGEPIDMEGAEELARQDSYQFQWWALSLVGARPFEAEKKRGADMGIDGNIFFHDDSNTKKTKQIILQVKSGHVNRGMIDALKGVVERENAELGVFITLQSPTRPMIKEAVSSGFYKSPSGKNYPKIQILTIEDLLYKNKNIERPPKVAINDITLKKANRYIYKGEQGKLKLE